MQISPNCFLSIVRNTAENHYFFKRQNFRNSAEGAGNGCGIVSLDDLTLSIKNHLCLMFFENFISKQNPTISLRIP
eukprot:UN16705